MINLNKNTGVVKLTQQDLDKIKNMISNFGNDYAANLILFDASTNDVFTFAEEPKADDCKRIIDSVNHQRYEVVE